MGFGPSNLGLFCNINRAKHFVLGFWCVLQQEILDGIANPCLFYCEFVKPSAKHNGSFGKSWAILGQFFIEIGFSEHDKHFVGS